MEKTSEMRFNGMGSSRDGSDRIAMNDSLELEEHDAKTWVCSQYTKVESRARTNNTGRVLTNRMTRDYYHHLGRVI